MRQFRGEVLSRRISVLRNRSGYSLITMMIKMSILSTLLGTCGVCLHAMFRVDHSERVTSQLLSSLRRMERQLRADEVAGVSESIDGKWQIVSASGTTRILWSEFRGVVQREERESETVTRRERFIFPAGTRVEFGSLTGGTGVVRVFEGSPLVRYPEAGDGGAVLNKPESVALPEPPRGFSRERKIEIQIRSRVAGTEVAT